MKRLLILLVLAVAAVCILLATCLDFRSSVWGTFKNPETETMLKRFIAEKINQANAVTSRLPSEFQTLFKYAGRGNWLAYSNSVRELEERIDYWNSLGYGVRHWHGYRGAAEDFVSDAAREIGWHWEPPAPPRLEGTGGEVVKEIYGAFEAFVAGDEKYSTEFGRQIVDAIPPGSIYFGGSDAGRYIVTVMCRSQVSGDPFFVLSQNPLPNASYLAYLRSMYAGKIYTPTDRDLQKIRQDYEADLWRRAYANELLTNSQIDVTGLRRPLTKMIFDQNPDRKFYVDEGILIDWMYPQLEPHDLIFKLNRQPAAALSDDIIQRDRDFWTNDVRSKIGGWLHSDTSMATVAAFAGKIFGRQDFSGFTGDQRFVQNAYSQRAFSKLRASQAGLYAWRASHAAGATDQARMVREANFAFRQAWALCPYSPEAVFRYVNFLLEQKRVDDAILVAETATKLPQCKGDGMMARMVVELKLRREEK